jgi:membrane fusion protein (multidrug efflux system)
LVVGGLYGFRAYAFSSTHVVTDDAYVTSNVVPISARVAGNAERILVKDNQRVEAGKLLVALDDSTYQVDVDQAAANLAMARAAAEGATVSVGLSTETGNAQIAQAQGGLAESEGQIGTALAGVERARAQLATAQASLQTSMANEVAAETGVRARLSARARAVEQASAAEAVLRQAEASVGIAQANLRSAEATAANAAREADRAAVLAQEGALARSVAEARATTATDARSRVDAARQQLQSAQANVAQRRADLNAARAQIREAEDAAAQARAQAKAAASDVNAQRARVQQETSGVTSSQQAVESARARSQQATAGLQAARTAPRQVSISAANRKTALARVAQARAALEAAQVALNRTRLVAPISGTISRKTIQPGQQIAGGQQVMTIIPDERPWVVANFKETQLAQLRPGLKAEVEVDALPGVHFHGRIDSISKGTGSVFALLPPDNASGNFTKVVQRVPVKIVLDEGQPGLDRLRAGLSAVATVGLRD